MRRIAEIRKEIADGAPSDEVELRRLALQATGRISDPHAAERLHAKLSEQLLQLVLARHFEAAIPAADVERAVEAVLAEIERASSH